MNGLQAHRVPYTTNRMLFLPLFLTFFLPLVLSVPSVTGASHFHAHHHLQARHHDRHGSSTSSPISPSSTSSVAAISAASNAIDPSTADTTVTPSTGGSNNNSSTGNNTANTAYLQTWMHSTGEVNYKSPVQPGNVRQSHLYSIQVASLGEGNGTYFDSFVYETIPRNGNGNILNPNDPTSITTDDDGITIEADINMTMAWTQFLYQSDVVVKIHRLDGFPANASSVSLRPSTLNYSTTASGGDVYIRTLRKGLASR